MATVIKIVASAGPLGLRSPLAGQFLETCDFESGHGRGFITSTRDLRKAKKFSDSVEAWEYWRRQSTTTPLRFDGKPNRPLTAFTCEMIEVPDMDAEPLRIKTIKAFIADSPEGEGVCAVKSGGVWYPLVSADETRFKTYLKIAGELVNSTGQPLRVVEFARLPEEAELLPSPTTFPGFAQLRCDHIPRLPPTVDGKPVAKDNDYWCDECGPLDNDHAALLLYRASTALDAAAMAFADFQDRYKDDWRKFDREIQFERFVALKVAVLNVLDAFTKEKMPHCALVDCKIMGPHEHKVEGPGNA